MSEFTPTNSLNLEAEAILDPSIHFNAPPAKNANNPQQIFLTGSTGFLGGYLLGDLLQQTSADMHCLTRGQDTEVAKERLIQNLQFCGRWRDDFRARIIPVLGDLSQARLGLDETMFRQLAGQIDVVYHSGGWVNNVRSYALLKSTNVDGTEAAIRLATLTQMKPLHFVSSLAIFFTDTYAGAEVVQETDTPKYDPHVKSGYIQSKWVADRLVETAQRRGLPASIYRPARVTADSQTGKTSAVKDLLSLFIKSCLHMEQYPALDITIPMVPVDYLSRAIVHLSQQEASLGKAFHFINDDPMPWADLFGIIRGLGYGLEEIDYPTWRRELKQQIEQNPDKEFLKLIQALLYAPNNLFFDRPRFDMSNIRAGLAGSPIVWPPVDEKLVATYLAYFQQVGFLPPAQHVPTLANK